MTVKCGPEEEGEKLQILVDLKLGELRRQHWERLGSAPKCFKDSEEILIPVRHDLVYTRFTSGSTSASGGMKMSESDWALVTRIGGDIQAELLRGLLEAHEIPVLLSQEGAGRALGLTVGPLGEVDILVPGQHLAEAQSILRRYQAGEFEASEDEED